MRDWLQDKLTRMLLWLLLKLNPSKDRCLSVRLHDIADQYDTRPTGQWRPKQ